MGKTAQYHKEEALGAETQFYVWLGKIWYWNSKPNCSIK